ncbi:MAG: ribosome biogenesis GTP-binding protein YihA/YsxC [Gammaproteobacteria bacterium]|nr:ribosome biogenesis GTP-binding protein YihA/YsxC [Gammaproteobacteria bacterium]
MIAFHQARFIKSADTFSNCPPDVGTEVAFCGRSNAGKSSAINIITGQKKLARVSRTPGRTQLINFFRLTDSSRLVDLPGYGFAKVPDAVKIQWHKHLDTYLRQRQSLTGLILLSDIRHPLKEFDLMMIEWNQTCGVPLHILLTKADKLSKGAQQATLSKVRQELPDSVSAQVFSATRPIGIETVHGILNSLLEGE